MGIGSRRAVFLDRDGVINRPVVRDGVPYAPATLEQLEVLPDVPAALGRLRTAGFDLIVVTNQPDVARGTQKAEVIDAMHQQLAAVLPLDGFYVCMHDDADDCACRKPRPGLLMDAARDRNIALSSSFIVGDRWKDINAGRAAGCTTVFVDWNYKERRPEGPDAIVGSLGEAADWILSRSNSQ